LEGLVSRSSAAIVILFLWVLPAAAQPAADGPLTIDRAVELAIERNERAAAAETGVEAAQARVGLARTAFLPQLSVVGDYRNDSGAEIENSLSAAAVLSQPILDARAFPLMRAARYDRDAARLSADEVKRLLGYEAADAFLFALNFEQVLRAAENRREFAKQSLNDARARFEAGLVSSNDVTRAELEYATAERNVAQAEGSVRSSLIALETVLNAPVTGPLVVPVEVLAEASEAPAVDTTVVAAAQDQRKDIGARKFELESLRAFAEEPSRRFIPTVRLNAQAYNENEGRISNRNNDAFVGVTLNWPFFDAGIRRAETSQRNAIARGAELELELALRNVEQEIRTAAVLLDSQQAALREATAALRAARKNADETNALYREGLASALELADANQNLFEAEVAETTTRYRMAQAYLALRAAKGLMPVGGEDE
jgi:outer membrane protein TolC